jgi:NTP pyrophosphatase (non-canonical NTP hydrolase)
MSYASLGLCGEAGELANKVKRIHHHKMVEISDLVDELGDVLWYCAAMAYEIGMELDDVAKLNLQKLADRE